VAASSSSSAGASSSSGGAGTSVSSTAGAVVGDSASPLQAANIAPIRIMRKKSLKLNFLFIRNLLYWINSGQIPGQTRFLKKNLAAITQVWVNRCCSVHGQRLPVRGISHKSSAIGLIRHLLAILIVVCYDVIVHVNDNIIAEYAFTVKALCYTGKDNLWLENDVLRSRK
jgi:hypothetical protein